MSSWSRYIKDFVSYLKIERGLADNSVEAYEKDVSKLHEFALSNDKEAKDINYAFLRDFVQELYSIGLSARSQARIISGIKHFFKYLLLEKEIESDPSELLEMPQIGRKLPEVLLV